MIVARMKQRQMQDRRALVGAEREAHGLGAHRVIVGRGPAVRPRHHAHAVGAQRMEFARHALHGHGFEISVSRHQEIAVDALQERRPALARIGPREQRQQRMLAAFEPRWLSASGRAAAASAMRRTQRCTTGFFWNPSRANAP
jgi:hypothetical protein